MTDRSAKTDNRPTLRSRLMFLLLGPLYLWYLIAMLWIGTGAQLWHVVAMVLSSAAGIAAILVAFGIKADRHRDRSSRFQLSSILLAMLLLSIYLAVIRWTMAQVPTDSFSLGACFAIGNACLLLVIVTTVILMGLTEALLWLALLIRNWVRSRSDGEPS